MNNNNNLFLVVFLPAGPYRRRTNEERCLPGHIRTLHGRLTVKGFRCRSRLICSSPSMFLTPRTWTLLIILVIHFTFVMKLVPVLTPSRHLACTGEHCSTRLDSYSGGFLSLNVLPPSRSCMFDDCSNVSAHFVC